MNDPFQTTRWSLVLAAQKDSPESESRAALETLCQAYWYPLYVYVRRQTPNAEEARDLTQAFFVALLERRVIESADPDRGHFRSFLLTACRRFIQNEWRRQRAFKRGGDHAILSLDFDVAESRYQNSGRSTATAETTFERQWAISLLDQVLQQLRHEYRERDREHLFDALKFVLTGGEKTSYRTIASQLAMSEDAIKVVASRLKIRYRELLRAEIASTVESEDAIHDEIQRLFQTLASPG